MGTITTFVGDTEVKCAWTVIRTVNGRCAAPFNGIDLHVARSECLDADVYGAWIFVITVLRNFATVRDFLVHAGAPNTAVYGAGISLHTICIHLTIRT